MMRDVWKAFTQGKTWVKFCLPSLHFLMGRTEGKNESFITIRMRIHQNLCSSLTHGGYAKIYDCYVHNSVFATVSVLRGTRWVPWCI